MKGLLLATAELTRHDRRDMCALLDGFFLGVSAEGFEADLADKDHALLLRDAAGRLCGFSTLALVPVPQRPRGEWVLFSGDTIVDRGHRSSAALAACWIDAVQQLRAAHQVERLVWLLICSSVRTYRFLPLFFREFSPHPEAPTPGDVQRELDRLASWHYGAAYDPASGIVRLERPQPLRADLPRREAERREPERRESEHRVPEHPEPEHRSVRPVDALASFFARRNPGHARGDELVCHCVIADANLTPAGRRMVEAGARRRAAEVLLGAGP